MKLHEFEIGKAYQKVNGNPDFLYKVDKDKDTNENLGLWYRHKDSAKWYFENITLSIIKEEFKECCQNPVAFKDWEEGRVYSYKIKDYNDYYIYIKDKVLWVYCPHTKESFISYISYNHLMKIEWIATDIWI